jgi:lysophospholipase II
MHGLGDTSAGWESTADMLADQLPHVKFIVPTAPTRSITLNMGMSMPGWYDIKSLGAGDEDLSPTRVLDTCDGIEDSRAAVEAMLEAEHRATGLPYNRMMLGGFSQGGALSLYTGLQIDIEKRLAGLVVMSGYLPNHTNLKVTAGMDSLPILHCHGREDPLVRFHYAEHGRKYLVDTQGFSAYNLKGYSRLEHSVNNDVIRDVLNFLRETLPAGAQYVPPPKEFTTMSVKELKAAVAQANLGRQCVGFSEKAEFVDLLTGHYKAPHVK